MSKDASRTDDRIRTCSSNGPDANDPARRTVLREIGTAITGLLAPLAGWAGTTSAAAAPTGGRGTPLEQAPELSPPQPPSPVETTLAQSTSSSIRSAVYCNLWEDGTTGETSWREANKAFYVEWANPGGDWSDAKGVRQGANHYASLRFSTAGPGAISIDVTRLALKLLERNSGIYLKAAGGHYSSRSGTQPPVLRVATDKGAFACPCIASLSIHPSSNRPLVRATMHSVMLLKFDLSPVVGTIRNAALDLYATVAVSKGGITADYLEMPRLIVDPAREIGGVISGIAATVERDVLLAKHPSIVKYDDLTDDSVLFGPKRRFVTTNCGWPAQSPEGHWFEHLPGYGLTALVVRASPHTPHILDAYAWSQPQKSEPEPHAKWKRPYVFGERHGYEELYLRYWMRVDPGVAEGMNESGVKLTSMEGAYKWSTSGAVTLPRPQNGAWWGMSGLHTAPSKGTPGFVRLMWYQYTVDKWVQDPQGYGLGVKMNVVPNVCLQVGRGYWIEQRIKLNTIVGQGLRDPEGIEHVVADGLMEIWVDGVLVHRQEGMRIRGTPESQIQDLSNVIFYHGGLGKPRKAYTYALAGICSAIEYIGPARVLDADAHQRPPAPVKG